MTKEDDIQKEKTEDEEDLLDFDLDDLIEDDIDLENSEPESEEEIIELVDLVEKGKKGKEEEGDEEIADLFEEDQEPEEEDDFEGPTREISGFEEISDEERAEQSVTGLDISLSDLELEGEPRSGKEIGEEGISENLETDLDISLSDLEFEGKPEFEEKLEEEEILEDNLEEIFEEEPAEEVESDVMAKEGVGSEEKIDEQELSESDLEEMLEGKPVEEVELDLEKSLELEESLDDLIKETKVEKPPAESATGSPYEVLSEEDTTETGPPEPRAVSPGPTDEKMTVISEKKIEEIVTRVVHDVVERVARETMAGVAERVITEAIDALKQSLESESE